MELSDSDARYSADELAALTQTPRRTIRYYIQLGLLERPIGETRAAYYTPKHVGQLLEIRRLTEAGLSLEAISSRLKGEMPESELPASPGSVAVLSHLHLGPGLELVIDPGRAELRPEELHRLARQVLAAYQRLKS